MRFSRGFIVLLLVAAAALLAGDLILVSQNSKLRALAQDYKASQYVQVGESVRTLDGYTAGGHSESVGYGAGRPCRLIVVFDARCGECALNAPSWRQLLAGLDRSRVRPVGVGPEWGSVSRQGLRGALLPELGLGSVKTILQPGATAVYSYRFRLTPQTILVDSSGVVRGVWSGVLSASAVADIRADVGRLPPIAGRKTVLARR